MSRHLDERELTAVVAGLELGDEARQHLATCLDCRRAVGTMEGLIGERRRQMTSGEPDWEVQQAAVLARLPVERGGAVGRRLNRWVRPVMAAAAVVMVAAVVGLMAPEQPEITSNGTEIPVDQILAEVDALLDDDSIPGFEVIDPGLEIESYITNGSS